VLNLKLDFGGKMTFSEYQKKAIQTELMVRNNQISANDLSLIAKVLGLVGETGEVAEKFKKTCAR
jgi:NTP pyrophosphatase (non-canonical NTP hydrolase)